jgi:multidrug efflux system outer membrane protein
LLGSVSTTTTAFLTGPSKTWSLAADLAGPIFTFGAISGQVRSAEAAQQESMLFYRTTILNAFRETNDALVGSLKKREEAEAQARRVRALSDYARLSRLRFDNGAASYIEVLYAENELFGAQLVAISTLADRYTQLINVYKAMGGGWVDASDPMAASKTEGK